MYTAEEVRAWGGVEVGGVGNTRVLANQRVKSCRDEERCFSEKAEDGRWRQESTPPQSQTLKNRGAIFHHRGYLRSFHPPRPDPFDPPRFPPANRLFKIKNSQRKAERSSLPSFCADAQWRSPTEASNLRLPPEMREGGWQFPDLHFYPLRAESCGNI